VLARFERVKEGMSREEVIRTVGPPGDYSSDQYLEKGFPDFSPSEIWASDEGFLLVDFDVGGTAREVRVSPLQPRQVPPPLTERIRRWLGL
jgi:hypothetical protein